MTATLGELDQGLNANDVAHHVLRRNHILVYRPLSVEYDGPEGEKMSADLPELRKLPVDEKLRIVEALWDDIAAASGEVKLDDRHFAEAKRRSEALKANPSKAIDRDELWRYLNG